MFNRREGNKEDVKKMKEDGSFFSFKETVKGIVSQVVQQFRIVSFKLNCF